VKVKEEEREAMARLFVDDGAQWHPSGFSPVCIGFGLSTAPLFMMGFTKLQCPLRRYMLSRSIDDPKHGR
jgi:hypothetical protein